MTKIYTLRVQRIGVNKEFPFDRIYLVKYADRSVIKNHWRYCMVLPVVGSLEVFIKNAMPKDWQIHSHKRNDARSGIKHPTEEDWKKFISESDWVCVVPILTRIYKKQIEANPNYLVAQDWYYRQKNKNKNNSNYIANSPLPDQTYLQTPTQTIRPICAACPQLIAHMAGECAVGQSICLTNLALGSDYFKEGLSVAEPTPHVFEDELVQGVINGDDVY